MSLEREVDGLRERVEALQRALYLAIDALDACPCPVGDEGCESKPGYGEEVGCRVHRAARRAREAAP